MKLNPIVKKDLQVSARSMRLSWGLFAYEAILVAAFLLVIAVVQEESNYMYSSGNIYSYLIYLFPILACVQLGITVLIIPILTAASISGERERQTLDIMLTTCMSPISIVMGKLTSSVLQILFYVIASLPIMALSFVVGGLSWGALLLYVIFVVMLAYFSGSIGVLCSTICRKSIPAIILSFIIYIGIYGCTFIPLLIMAAIGSYDYGESMLLLLLNPIIFFEEFFMMLMTGETLFSTPNISSSDVGFISYFIVKNGMWIYLSGICIVLLTVFFVLLAAWRLNPVHTSGRRKVRE